MFNLFKKKATLKEEIINNKTYPSDLSELENERLKNFSFKLGKVEAWRYLDFCERHLSCVAGKFGTIGGGISVEITPTGLGNIVKCKCKGCGSVEDITYIENW